jgi:hypothetical protein
MRWAEEILAALFGFLPMLLRQLLQLLLLRADTAAVVDDC